MSRPPTANRVPTKDMYWFAHGGIESSNEKCLNQRSTTPGECEEDNSDSSSPILKSLQDRKNLYDDQKSPFSLNSVVDSGNSSGPSSLEISERSRNTEKRIAVEERRKQLMEAEQERNDAVLRKHMEREAAIEARRNAQRSNISFAFGSSVPRNVESLQSGDSDKINRILNASGSLQKGDNLMSRSMTAAVPAPRGRRKNDLMPTVPYERTLAPKSVASSSTRKRSVSMTRLDQLAQPRRHYVEANKANSTSSSGATSLLKDTIKSPTRPLSSASEQSGGSGRVGNSVTRRVRSSPRKPRPVSIAGTVPDSKLSSDKVSPIKKTFLTHRKPITETKKASPVTSKPSSAKSNEKSKPIEKIKSTNRSTSTPKPAKQPVTKQPTPPKSSSPKVSTTKKGVTNKKKADMITVQPPVEIVQNQLIDSTKSSGSPPDSPTPDNGEAERNNAKRIISEEEAKAALAEKRRLAREQAEKEAELERQRQEQLRQEEEERLRLEEEEQKKMEEEQLRLLEEHRKLEEEKLRKAIEEYERREEEERVKREEEQRLKVEQERKALEEAEKQRIELEEKLRKEEEERAERKKRLEKIMSRTRGKSSGTSPSGSVSGSEQLDSSENPQENLSSGANSLDSNAGEIGSEPLSLEGHAEKLEPVSDGTSIEANPTYEVASDNESLNDIIMPKSETASQDNSLVIHENIDLKTSETDLQVLKSEILEVQAESVIEGANSVVSEETINAASVTEEIETQSNDVESNVNEINDALSQVVDVPVGTEKNEGHDLKEYEEQNVEVEGINTDLVSFQTSSLLETTPFVASHNSEAAIVNETEVILSFGEDIRKSISDNCADVANTLLPDVSPPSERCTSEQNPEESEIEHSHFSTSSDIKLPDPIYETSDDGSVSSERQQQEHQFGLQYEEHNQESQPIADEVFNEQETFSSEETNFNPFEKQTENSSSHLMAAYESQFEIGGMQDSIFAFETADAPVPDYTKELAQENVKSPSLAEINEVENVKETALPDVDDNKENLIHSASFNPFANNFENELDPFANKENVHLDSPGNEILEDISMYKSVTFPGQLPLENNQIQSEDISLNNAFQEPSLFEQNFENQSVNKSPSVPSDSVDLSNVTIIKAEGSDECIGIISSVEHDHISNNLVQSIQNEQLKSNFEYSSITDSEESSLDSNLSQVMTVEVSEKNSVDFNNFETVSTESSGVLNNDQAENPFNEYSVNGSSISKSNGDHYSEKEILSNGHRIESTDPNIDQIGSYVQLDSKHISSVDHSKNNIFDNVDAVEFGKMSPDPFLLKGSSNQISGNPFLLQDDQKQVLMAPDFLN